MEAVLLALVIPIVQETDWAARLGDRDPAVRDEATRALLDLGDEAIPALTPLREHADPEIRARAEAILEQVEPRAPLRAILRCAPQIDLAVDTPTPLADVCARLAEHFGLPVRTDTGAPPWSGRLEGVTLLQAADAISRDLGIVWSVSPEGLAFAAGKATPSPAAYVGPFKVWVSSLTAARTTRWDGTQVMLQMRLEGLHERQSVTLGPRELRIDQIELDAGFPIEPRADAFPLDRLLEFSGQGLISIDHRQLYEGATGASFSLAEVPPEARTIRRIAGRIRLGVPVDRLEWVFDSLGRRGRVRCSQGPSTATLNSCQLAADADAGVLSVTGALFIQVQGGSLGPWDFMHQLALARKHAVVEFEDASGRVERLRPPGWIHIELLTNDLFREAANRGTLAVRFSGSFGDADFTPVRLRVRLPKRWVTDDREFEIRDVPLP